MTLEEAVKAFEADLIVSNAAGFPDAELPSRLDMNRAPNGGRYVIITSAGQKYSDAPDAAYFVDEERAAEEWLRQAWSYAEARGGKQLFWRERPVFAAQEYLAVNQAGLMSDPRWRQSITLRLGTVHSRLLVSKAAEDSKE